MGKPAFPPKSESAGLTIEDVEPRILYSADAAALVGFSTVPDASVTQVAPVDVDASQTQTDSASLVVIDRSVSESELLVRDLQQRSENGEQIQWLLIDSTQNGIEAISDHLENSDTAFHSIHIVTHGDQAGFELGSQTINADTLRTQAQQIASWSGALTQDADLLLYGCDLAGSTDGQALIQSLSVLTGADIAASTDTTGSLRLGANWELEWQTGQIESGLAVSAHLQSTWATELSISADGNQAIVNETTGGTHELANDLGASQIATNGVNTVVVWEEGNDIFYRLFPAGGEPDDGTGEFEVGNFGGPNRVDPAVAMAADGTFVIVWTSDNNQDGDNNGIFGQRFDASGSPISAPDRESAIYTNPFEFRANDITGNDQTEPAVALLPNGNAVVSWTTPGAGGTTDVRVGIISPTGEHLASATPFADNAHSYHSSAIATNATTGEIAFTAQQDESGENDKVLVARLDGATGASIGVATVLSDVTDDFSNPAISVNASNNELAVAFRARGGSENIAFSTASMSGSALNLSTPVTVNEASGSQESDPDIAYDTNGNIVVAWESDQGGSVRDEIFIRQYNSQLQPIGSTVLANQYTNDNQRNPGVVLTPVGATVFWEGEGNEDNEGIYVRNFLLTQPGISATPSATETTESGGSVTIDIVLDSEPIGEVTVQVIVSDGSEASSSTNVITFSHELSALNRWDIAQTITITGIDDAIADGDVPYTIQLAASSLPDGAYNGLPNTTVNLTNLDDEPTISSLSDADTNANEVSETAPAGTSVGITAFATDPGFTVTYDFLTPNNDFNVDSTTGVVTVKPGASFDYETQTTESFTIVASSTSGESTQALFTVNLLNANEPPMGGATVLNASEDMPYPLGLTDFTLNDPDTGDSLSAINILSLPTTGTLELNGSVLSPADLPQQVTAAQLTANWLIYKPAADSSGANHDSFSFTVADQAGLESGPQTATVNVAAVNDPPVISSLGGGATASHSLIEGTTALPDVVASDVDSTVTYSLSGTDSSLFSLDTNTGAFSFISAPDFEFPGDADLNNRYEVTITASDGALADTQDVTIRVGNQVEPIVLTVPGSTSTPEDTSLSISGSSAIDGENRASLQVSISVDTGQLTLSPASGVAFQSGDGIQDANMTFTGPLGAINQAISALTYQPDLNYAGNANITIQIADPSDSRTDSASIGIVITAVNDEPVAGGSRLLGVAAGGATAIDSSVLSASDAEDNDATLVYTLDTNAQSGSLSLNGTVLTDGDTFTQADINAGSLIYVSTAIDSSNDSIVLVITDSTGSISAKFTVDVDVAVTGAGNTSDSGDDSGDDTSGDESADEDSDLPLSDPGTGDGDDDDESNYQANPAAAAGPADATNKGGALAATESDDSPELSHAAESELRLLRGSRQFVSTTGAEYDSWRISDAKTQYAQSRFGTLRAEQFVTDFNAQDLDRSLAQLRDQMRNPLQFDRTVTASGFALSTGVSIGYVLWLLRGGAILSSILASMPAWRSIDPLPVLGTLDGANNEPEDDDSLEAILEKAGDEPAALDEPADEVKD